MPVRSLNSSVLKWPDAKLVEREVRCWVKNIKNYHPEIIRVGYFGSYARGDWGVGSDLDLIVIVVGSFQLQKKETLNWDLNKLSVPVDLFVYTKEEWEVLKKNKGRFYQTLMHEAIWFYPKDNKDKIILDLAIEVKNKLKEKFKNNLISVCLFGSAARKTLRKGSDIDFLVVIEKASSSYHKRIKEILPMVSSIRESKKFLRLEALHLDLEPSFLILSKEELKAHPSILIDIAEEGIILEDKDDFLRKELASIKEKLTHFGAVKKITPQGYYWIIKPDIKPGEIFEI